MPIFTILSILALFGGSANADYGLRGARRSTETLRTFRVTVSEDLIRNGDGTFMTRHNFMAIPIIDGVEKSVFYDIILPSDFNATDLIESDQLVVSLNEIIWDADTIIVSDKTAMSWVRGQPVIRNELQNGKVDERRVAALRVSMAGGSPDTRQVGYSKGQIYQQMFVRDISLKSQIEHCSNGKMKITPGGVYEVTVPGIFTDFPAPAHLRNKALQLFAEQLGVASANDLFDHVIVMLPPNEYPGFVGNAGVRHWVSTLNNLRSLDVMVYMHEIGHNFGLNHAVLSDSSGDYSSYMSATGWSPNLDGPAKCFNGASNRQLGWGHSKQIDLSTNPNQIITVAAFSETGKTNDPNPTLIEIGPFSLQYNYASGFNAGTELLRNEVTVSYHESGKTVVDKQGLVPSGSIFTTSNFQETGKEIRIAACTKIDGNANKASAMNIGIALGGTGSPCDISPPAIPPTPPSIPPTLPSIPNTCKNLNKRKCRASPSCVFSGRKCSSATPPASDNPFKPNNKCSGLGKKRCRKATGCSLLGNTCLASNEKPRTNSNVCSGLARRKCNRAPNCRFSNGTCSAEDIFVS